MAQQGVLGNRHWWVVILVLAGLGGCAQPACLLRNQAPATIVTLFFGRDMPGGGQVSDADWAAFAAGPLTDQFPDGFTVSDAGGQWRAPGTTQAGREPTKIVLIAVPEPNPGLPARVRHVTEAYRAQFRQEAVGVVSTAGCAVF